MAIPRPLKTSAYPLLKLHAANQPARLRAGATRVERNAAGEVLVRINLPDLEDRANERPVRAALQPELRLKARRKIATRRNWILKGAYPSPRATLALPARGGRAMRWAFIALTLVAELSVGVLLWKQLVANHRAPGQTIDAASSER